MSQVDGAEGDSRTSCRGHEDRIVPIEDGRSDEHDQYHYREEEPGQSGDTANTAECHHGQRKDHEEHAQHRPSISVRVLEDRSQLGVVGHVEDHVLTRVEVWCETAHLELLPGGQSGVRSFLDGELGCPAGEMISERAGSFGDVGHLCHDYRGRQA